MLDNVVLLHSHSSDHLSFHQRQLVALIDCTVKLFCKNVHEFDLIFYLANKAMPNKNGVLDILSHVVRPRNTHGEAETIFMKLTASFNMFKKVDQEKNKMNWASGHLCAHIG